MEYLWKFQKKKKIACYLYIVYIIVLEFSTINSIKVISIFFIII